MASAIAPNNHPPRIVPVSASERRSTRPLGWAITSCDALRQLSVSSASTTPSASA
ncbi:hypothetical protein OV079_47030 [Nannocystis pusilla]|uniref:Uncharacterized protein n=1 Tax=Nannocystis pusilla TaxID=889268 RepID=A0A9X3EZ04_9BACT|nr:hypothetical protein [Nannocystis pusilla]MCY1012968.1 hypothetical protein [Nannocystis pusilla]